MTDPHAANLNVRMPMRLRQELQDIADQLGVHVSVVARTALSLGLSRAHESIENAIEESQMADAVQIRETSPKRRTA